MRLISISRTQNDVNSKLRVYTNKVVKLEEALAQCNDKDEPEASYRILIEIIQLPGSDVFASAEYLAVQKYNIHSVLLKMAAEPTAARSDEYILRAIKFLEKSLKHYNMAINVNDLNRDERDQTSVSFDKNRFEKHKNKVIEELAQLKEFASNIRQIENNIAPIAIIGTHETHETHVRASCKRASPDLAVDEGRVDISSILSFCRDHQTSLSLFPPIGKKCSFKKTKVGDVESLLFSTMLSP